MRPVDLNPPATAASDLHRGRSLVGVLLHIAAFVGIAVLALVLRTISLDPDKWQTPDAGAAWYEQPLTRMFNAHRAAVDWDSHLSAHPDENFVAGLTAGRMVWPRAEPVEIRDGLPVEPIPPTDWRLYFDPRASTLNPYVHGGEDRFAYGQLPVSIGAYLNDPVLGSGEWLRDWPTRLGYPGRHLLFRALTMLTDWLTVLFCWWLGYAVAGARGALLTMLLAALSPMLLEHARYFVVDPYAGLFGTIALAALASSMRRLRLVPLPIAAIATAAAVSSKISAVVLLGAWAVWAGWWLLQRGRGRPGFVTLRVAVGLLIAGTLGLATFRVTSPYAFGYPSSWFEGARPTTESSLEQLRRTPDHHSVAHRENLREKADRPAEIAAVPGGVRDWLWRHHMWFNAGWVEAMQVRIAEQRDPSGLPYFLPSFNRVPFLYSLENLRHYALGQAVFWPALGGFVAVVLSLRRPSTTNAAALLMAAFAGGVIYQVGSGFAQLIRYMHIGTPAMLALAAWALIGVAEYCQRQQTVERRWSSPLERFGTHAAWLGVWGCRLLVAHAVWSGLAYAHVYSGEHPYRQASAWIYANIPQGSGIANDLWTTPQPSHLDGLRNMAAMRYRAMELYPYEEDAPDSLGRLLNTLEQADVISITSDLFVRGVAQRPLKLGMRAVFYQKLLTGQLGFQVAAVFGRSPSLLGVGVDERAAEHGWMVFNRPTVLMFRKTEQLSREQLMAELPLNPQNPPSEAELLALVPQVAWQAADHGLTIDPERPVASWWSMLTSEPVGQTLWWWLTLTLLAAASWPMVYPLFRNSPDGGWGLCRIVGLAIPALVCWWVGLALGTGWTLLTLLIALSIYIVFCLFVAARQQPSWRDNWRRHLPAIVTVEVFAFAILACFVWARVHNPSYMVVNHSDPTNWACNGEKIFELVLFSQFARQTPLPPQNPWAAGWENYYYMFGYAMWSVPTLLLKFPAGVAFNLGMASLAAVSFLAAFSVIARLTRSIHWSVLGALLGAIGGTWTWPYLSGTIAMNITPGAALSFAAIFVLPALFAATGMAAAVLLGRRRWTRFAGGQPGLAVVLTALNLLVGVVGSYLLLANWTTANRDVSLALHDNPVLTPQPATERLHDYFSIGEDATQHFWFERLWKSSRITSEYFNSDVVRKDHLNLGQDPSVIEEWPQFTFAFSDFHAHAMSMPLFLGVLAFGTALALGGGRGMLAFGLTAVFFGSVYATNAWDLPSLLAALLAIFAACWLAPLTTASGRPIATRLALTIGPPGLRRLAILLVVLPLAIAVAGLACAAFYLVNPKPEIGSIGPVMQTWASARVMVMRFGPWLTLGLIGLLAMVILRARSMKLIAWAPLIALALLAIAGVTFWAVFYAPTRAADAASYVHHLGSERRSAIGTLLGPGLLMAMQPGSNLQLGLITLAIAVVAALWAPTRRLLIGGALLSAGIALFCVTEFVELFERMNTVFKIGLGAWWLMAIGAATLLAAVPAIRRRVTASSHEPRLTWSAPASVFAVVLAWTVAGSMLISFPGALLGQAAKDQRPLPIMFTLDASQFMARYEPEDWAIVEFLRSHHDTQLTVLEGGYHGRNFHRPHSPQGPDYTYTGRIAASSGTRCVLGWHHHMRNCGVDVNDRDRRARAIQRFFQTTDPQQRVEVLDRYRPDYVIIGPFERILYGDEVEDRMSQTPGLREVFRWGSARIYAPSWPAAARASESGEAGATPL